MQAQPFQEFLHLPVPSEEAVAVGFAEGHHAGVGAGGRRGGGGEGPRQFGAEAGQDLLMPRWVGRIQSGEHGQAGRQLDRMQDEGDDGPGGRLQAVGLGQQVGELAEALGQVGGGEDEQGALALPDSPLELQDARHAQPEGFLGVDTHAGCFQRVE